MLRNRLLFWGTATTTATPAHPGVVPLSPSTSTAAVRWFARRPKDHLNDPNEELMEEVESITAKKTEGAVSAWDMEFFGEQMLATSLNDKYGDNDDDDDDEEAGSLDEEYRRKQEEIQAELDSRTGRPWKDPWEIKEEQWMTSTKFDDLPDWSPEHVSRISQERVKIHPGTWGYTKTAK
jgi:hypothetical protein